MVVQRVDAILPIYDIANAIEGSIHLDHIYWLGKTTDSMQYVQLFKMTTVNNMSQCVVVNDCVTEFVGFDIFNADGWTHGATFKFTNSYFRALFSSGQWWAGRVMECKKPIDTLWVENCTFSGGGLLFLQQEAATRFAYFNHNTIINSTKTWLPNKYFQNLFVVNNLFINHNWVGEDTVNVTTGGANPDTSRTGTINLDSITIRQQVFTDWILPDSTIDNTKVGLDKLKIYVTDNIDWTDSLLNAYYTNRGNAWNTVGPYPLSRLDWGGLGKGPWQITNIPGIFMNTRTAGLFKDHQNIWKGRNTHSRVDVVTPAITNAAIVDLMIAWNQNQWGDPAYPTNTTDLLMSSYVPGDKDAATLPGFNGAVKSEAGAVGVAKVSDFIENYAQAGTPMLSAIDGLAIGSLLWTDAKVPADEWSKVSAKYTADILTGVAPVAGVAEQFQLNQNYPNPFNPTTVIEFTLPNASNVDLKVFNVLGQEVASLAHGMLAAGQHSVTFSAKDLSSGIYFYRLNAGTHVDIKKMVLLK
jgi:hypothetical protein